MTTKVGLALLVATLSLGAGCAHGLRTQSFAELPKYLNNGESVTVIQADRTEATGELASLSINSIAIASPSGTREVAEACVVEIRRRERRFTRGAWAGVAGGLGAGIPLALICSDNSEPGDKAACWAMIPAAAIIGTVVGVTEGTFKRSRPIYRSVAKPTPSACTSVP